jgi:uncharacterized protein (UPF0335 family)
MAGQKQWLADRAIISNVSTAEFTTGKQNKMPYPNNEPELVQPQALTETTKDKLRAYVTRIETLEAEKTEINDQIKEVKADAKALGFDVKAINGVVKFRKIDPRKRQEDEMQLDLYLHAMGEI